MEQDKQKKVCDAAIALARLLSDPHPGLFSWNEMCSLAYRALLAAAALPDSEPS